jgi:hypothetical protein
MVCVRFSDNILVAYKYNKNKIISCFFIIIFSFEAYSRLAEGVRGSPHQSLLVGRSARLAVGFKSLGLNIYCFQKFVQCNFLFYHSLHK